MIRSFVQSMGFDRKASVIIQTVLGLPRAVGVQVVAEGMDTELQSVAGYHSSAIRRRLTDIGDPMTTTLLRVKSP